MRRINVGRGLSRRAVLRGTGAALTLPLLESWPKRAWAAPDRTPPKRLSVFYFLNGMWMDNFMFLSGGAAYLLSPIL